MHLSVSVNGGDQVPAEDIVIFDQGVPIAAAIIHGNVVIFADSVRDRSDLLGILAELGVNLEPPKTADFAIRGSL